MVFLKLDKTKDFFLSPKTMLQLKRVIYKKKKGFMILKVLRKTKHLIVIPSFKKTEKIHTVTKIYFG